MEPAMCAAIDYNIPFAQVIPMIRQAGFEIISLGALPEHSGYATAAGITRIRKLIDENALTINSVHSSPPAWQLLSPNDALYHEAIHQTKKAIDAAFELNVSIVVIHAVLDGCASVKKSKIIDKGIESIGILSDYSRKNGVKLALENLPQTNSTALTKILLSEISDDFVGLCYDTGHENVAGTGFYLLDRFGDRLLTTHIADNWGEIDNHLLPYEGSIDWDQFRKILHSLDYSGDLLLEPMLVHSQFKDPAEFLAEGKLRAERLIEPPV